MQNAKLGPQPTPSEKGLTPPFLASNHPPTQPHRANKPCLTTAPPPARFSSTFILLLSILSILSTSSLPSLPTRRFELVSLHTTPLSFRFLHFTACEYPLLLLTATSAPELEVEGLSVLLLCWGKILRFSTRRYLIHCGSSGSNSTTKIYSGSIGGNKGKTATMSIK